MIKRTTASFIALLTLIFLSFQNCGKTFQSNGSSVSFSFCKLQPGVQSPFVSQKIHIKKNLFSSQQKLSQSSDKFSVVVDVNCVESSEDTKAFLSQPLYISPEQKALTKVALSISIPVGTRTETIEAEMEAQPCLLGLVENTSLKSTQATLPSTVNDPQAAAQAHLDFVEHGKTLGLQAEITQEVVIAFIDSGIDYNHPDLKNRMWKDSNGFHGFNFVAQNNAPMDDDGHGTHVAGLLAAIENNSYGVAGLTGDYVRIMALKALDSQGAGTSQDVYNSIQYAILNGADIINLSVESPGQNTLMEDAIMDATQAGIVVTAATGNASSEITAQNLFAPAYIGPSVAGMISVASVDTNGAGLSDYSNFSATYAEISAPGAETSSTSTGGLLSTSLGGGWSRIRGTSQATPIVTSAAAIIIGYLKTKNIPYTAAGVESFIKTDGVAINSTLVPYISGGRILNLGFMSRNLEVYFNNPNTAKDNLFDGDESTGNSCVIN